MSSPNSGHRERLRRRLITHGVRTLHDYERLELLLTFVLPRRDTKPLAKQLLCEHQSLRNVLIAATQTPDVVSQRFQVLAALCAYNEWLEGADSKKLSAANDVVAYVQPLMKRLTHEQVRVLYVDGQGNVLYELIRDSALSDQVRICMAEFVRIGLKYKAIAMILVHNHPSGDATPSQADRVFTQKLITACESVGIVLADHLVVGAEKVCSVLE